LPERPTRLLLVLAQIAATCCREIASETLDDIEANYGAEYFYDPELEKHLVQWWRAYWKIGQIAYILRDDFGVPMFDFSLSRAEPRNKSLISQFTQFIRESVF
jgi:hypothetical protein